MQKVLGSVLGPREEERERQRENKKVSRRGRGYESHTNFQLRETKQGEKLNPKQAEGNNKDNGKINEIE